MALSCAGDFFYLLLYIQLRKITLIFHSKVDVALIPPSNLSHDNNTFTQHKHLEYITTTV